ncbi:F-actin-uncapping protein LRRC16A-like isoform X2 [Daphnia pulicaria]|uniref:F-actin-uncapping protein LRRC16A-like isoform X2 n=1 Tax=Daphnia pulicaria TaxID=35523 RepID=UPI001EEC55B2|nr:F-actin-uncapping protein LRRC16A-like isoform X2 [Daphnia pulicaria]
MALGDKKDTLTHDIHESVRNVLGKHVKITERRAVRMETKGDKMENRILVFTPCRLFVFTPKIPTKIDFNLHYLDLQSIESKKLSQLTLSTVDKVYSFHTQEELNQTSDSLITAIVTAISDLFPGIPIDQVVRRIEVSPVGRMENLSNLLRGSSNDSELSIPCGNFSRQYACMCDYYGLPYREEVAWDVDTIYMSHNSKELNLRDFDHLDPKDLIPIIAALELNSFFLQFRCSHLKLSHECSERLLAVLKKSTTLEEIYVDNAGFKGDFANKLSMAIISNSNSSLHGIDLSHNLIEDRGIASLCGFLAKVRQGATHLSSSLSKAHRGLVKLSLSHCGLTGKGVAQIGHALVLNKCMASSLQHLDLSSNVAKDDINTICSFLAQPNVLTFLNLSNTDIALEPIFGALLRGGTTHLRHLDLSKNYFSTKKGKELPPSFKQYFTSALALRTIIVSHCKITPEALKNLLLGLACNESIDNVTLDLSNNILGNGGCHVLESCIHGVRCVSTLDISDNGIDVEMAGVLLSISRNKSMKKLILNKNFQNMKSKHATTVIDAFVHLLQEEDCVIEALCLVDCKLKSELYSLINAVGSNQSLQHLDLNGNYMGDPGARLLSKALQINTSLRALSIDRNSITVHGYSDIAYALESNRTLRCLSYPLHDIMVAAKTGTDKVDILWKQIQEALQRNMSLVGPSTNGPSTSVRSMQKSETSHNNSQNQLVDRLIMQVNEAIRSLQRQGSEGRSSDIENARNLLSDAHSAKELLGKLVSSVEVAQDNISLSSSMKPMVDEIQALLTSHLQSIGDNLWHCALQHCNTVMSDSVATEQLRKSIENQSLFPVSVIQKAVMDNATLQLTEQFNEMSAALCRTVSDGVMDEVVQSLTNIYKTLAGDSNLPLDCKKRSSTPDVLKSRTRINTEMNAQDGGDESEDTINNQQSDHSPVATPVASKRRNLLSRKLRPKSTVGMGQGASADDIPDLVPPLNEQLGSGHDDPDANEEEPGVNVDESQADVSRKSAPLKHLGLSRPKKPKTRLPTRSAALRVGGNSETASQESLDVDGDLSQGLDTFFHSTTMATTTGGSSVSLGSSRMRGSLGSVSSAELGSPSLESVSAESSPMHRSVAGDKPSDETAGSSSREELTLDEDAVKLKEKEKRKSEDDLSSVTREKRKDSGRGMGVRLLSSIFGKNPSPSPTGDGSPPPAPTKSPVAKTKLSSMTKEPESEPKLVEDETEPAAPKRSAVPSKLGIGVGGNVLAEMKARQERRISGILHKQNSEESDFSERSEKPEPSKANSLSPNPLGGIRLRPTPHTPEDQEPPKLPERNNARFVRPTGLEEVESERNKSTNPLTGFRLRHRGGAEEAETAKLEDKSNALNQIRLRATSTVVDDSPSPDPTSDAKANPLSGVRLRSTGINVTDPLKSPNNGDSSAEIKSESRNSLTKLKPPPLAPKPRPWSIVGSDKKTEDTDISDAAKENDAKEAVKPSKVRAMAAAVNFNNSNSDVVRRSNKHSHEEPDGLPAEFSEPKDGAAVDQVDGPDSLSSIGFLNQQATLPQQQQQQPLISQQSPASLILNNFSLEDAVDV